MPAIRGSCHTCGKMVVCIRLIDGEPFIVVGCDDCRVEVHFKLEDMAKAVSSTEVDYDQVLVDFVPKGKPS